MWVRKALTLQGLSSVGEQSTRMSRLSLTSQPWHPLCDGTLPGLVRTVTDVTTWDRYYTDNSKLLSLISDGQNRRSDKNYDAKQRTAYLVMGRAPGLLLETCEKLLAEKLANLYQYVTVQWMTTTFELHNKWMG